MTSGFLSSFSNKSSDSERRGREAFSLTGRKPGLRALDPFLWAARTLSTPKMTTVISKRAVTIPTRMPNSGAISKRSRVPKDNTAQEYNKSIGAQVAAEHSYQSVFRQPSTSTLPTTQLRSCPWSWRRTQPSWAPSRRPSRARWTRERSPTDWLEESPFVDRILLKGRTEAGLRQILPNTPPLLTDGFDLWWCSWMEGPVCLQQSHGRHRALVVWKTWKITPLVDFYSKDSLTFRPSCSPSTWPCRSPARSWGCKWGWRWNGGCLSGSASEARRRFRPSCWRTIWSCLEADRILLRRVSWRFHGGRHRTRVFGRYDIWVYLKEMVELDDSIMEGSETIRVYQLDWTVDTDTTSH